MSSVDPLKNEDSARLAGKIVAKLLRKKISKTHKIQIENFKNWFPVYEQEAATKVLKMLINDPGVPIQEEPDGSICLTDYKEASEFVESHGRDTKWYSGQTGRS